MSLDDIDFQIAQVTARMRMIRKSSDATQEEAATLCGISTRLYKSIETGARIPDLNHLLRFCAGFKCEIGDLLGVSRAQSAERPEEIQDVAQAILTLVRPTTNSEEIAREAALARYAYESACAKQTEFSGELRKLHDLVGKTS